MFISRRQGFTLIEVMVVVAIVAILGAIAYPSYQRYVIKANRSAAQQYLMNIANKQEQFLLDTRTYQSTTTALKLSDPPELASRYTFSIQNVTADPPAYQATATAIGPQASDGNLSIDQSGKKLPADKW